MGSRLERREKGAFMYRNFYANKIAWMALLEDLQTQKSETS
ncbi:hypothetical protein HRED_10896, partial [Candidatus Haloredivivus sp. G17]